MVQGATLPSAYCMFVNWSDGPNYNRTIIAKAGPWCTLWLLHCGHPNRQRKQQGTMPPHSKRYGASLHSSSSNRYFQNRCLPFQTFVAFLGIVFFILSIFSFVDISISKTVSVDSTHFKYRPIVALFSDSYRKTG